MGCCPWLRRKSSVAEGVFRWMDCDEPSRQKGGGKVKKGVIFFLLALSVLMIRSEYGDLPASLYGIFMGWTLGRAD